MDNIIQGLNQSAIVQTLSELQHNVKRVVHDIPDNAPYRTLQKRVLQPTSGDRSDPNATLNFTIPRHGNLSRLYLKASLYFPYQPDVPGFSQSDNEKALGPHFFASFFTNASLFIGGRCVETLYPENILTRAYQANSDIVDNILFGLKGRWSEYNEEIVGEGHEDLVSDGVAGKLQKYANFLIPLDFSIMRFCKDALDCNMLQKIHVEIKKRAVTGFQTESEGAYTRCELVCKYFNLDQIYRNHIRNTNFPPEGASLLSCHNILVEPICENPVISYSGQVLVERTHLSTFESVKNTFTIFRENPLRIKWSGNNIDPLATYVSFTDAHGLFYDNEIFKMTVINAVHPNAEFIVEGFDGTQAALIHKIKTHADFPNDNWFGFHQLQTVNTGDQVNLRNVDGYVQAGYTDLEEGLYTARYLAGTPGGSFAWYTLDERTAYKDLITNISNMDISFYNEVLVDIPSAKICTYPLNFTCVSNVIEILVSFQKSAISDVSTFFGDMVWTPSKEGYLRFKIMHDDRCIFDKYHWEMLTSNLNVSNLDIQDRTEMTYGLKVFPNDSSIGHIVDSIDLPPEMHTPSSLPLKHESIIYRIPFTLFGTEEFLNGGFNGKTMGSIKLIIEGSELLDEEEVGDIKGLVPRVIFRYKNLNRIDSKTGSVHSTFN